MNPKIIKKRMYM